MTYRYLSFKREKENLNMKTYIFVMKQYESKDEKNWRCNNTKEKWSNNGLKNIFTNNIIFEIHIWHFVIL
jgi:hypothetical protein